MAPATVATFDSEKALVACALCVEWFETIVSDFVCRVSTSPVLLLGDLA